MRLGQLVGKLTTPVPVPRLQLMLALLLAAISALVARAASSLYDCQPCIDRRSRLVQVLVHGTSSDVFWRQVSAAMVQSGTDMGIDLRVSLYDSYDDDRMASDIVAASKASSSSTSRPDALIVTVPSTKVREAIVTATNNGIAVFGLNSGYQFVESTPGILGFVSMDEMLGGEVAAERFYELRRSVANAATNDTAAVIGKALYVNAEKGNAALDARFDGFRTKLLELSTGPGGQQQGSQQSPTPPDVAELIIDASDDREDAETKLNGAFVGCPYDVVLICCGGQVDLVVSALDEHGCYDPRNSQGGDNDDDSPKTIVGTFDSTDTIYDAIVTNRLVFTVSQRHFLQGAIPVLLASLYVTTGMSLARPSDTGDVYLSGPFVLTKDDVLTDTLQRCEADAFPVCPNTISPIDGQQSQCDCIIRSDIVIGGVVHGITTDSFWDTVFAAAQQAARDMKVTLDFDRFDPQEDETVLHTKMFYKILSLCSDGVDGIFVSIPSAIVIDAIKRCLALNIPVISINAGADTAMELGLMHHIGQPEYNAGYAAGERLMDAGMTVAFCLDHAPGVSVTLERCLGFEQAISDFNDANDATRTNVTYMGKVDVPDDSSLLYYTIVEEAVGDAASDVSDDWDGIGLLLCGISQLPSALQVQEDHPKVIIGTFDSGSDALYTALDDGIILFGMDQQSYLQGYMPVPLLTYVAYTKQHLVNQMIETGPDFVVTSPSNAQQACEASVFEVCPQVPEEDMTYISDALVNLGYALVGLQGFVSVFFALWTVYYRKRSVVAAAQPIFLVLISLGCFVIALGIIPISIQGEYRYEQDPITAQLTDEPNDDVEKVDAACMAFPWLFGMGFVIVFSALFAKIWRVKKVFHSAARFRRKKVTATDVAVIMIVTMATEVAVLLAWQLAAPLKWEREVLERDLNGYPLVSVGKCTSDKFVEFLVPLVVFNIACLLYALYLCYIIRNVPSDFSEGTYISFSVISIFQVLLLAIPILVLVEDDTDAFYLIRAAIMFLISATVSLLIFVPKFYKLHFGQRLDGMARHRFGRESQYMMTSRANSVRSSYNLNVPSGRGSSWNLNVSEAGDGPEANSRRSQSRRTTFEDETTASSDNEKESQIRRTKFEHETTAEDETAASADKEEKKASEKAISQSNEVQR